VLDQGELTLHMSDADCQHWTARGYDGSAHATFTIGHALAMALRAGDRFAFHRYGTGDLGLWLLRDDALVLALGAIRQAPLGPGLTIADDPRMYDAYWSYVEQDGHRTTLERRVVDHAGPHVLWVDPAGIDHGQLGELLADQLAALMHQTDRDTIPALVVRSNDPSDLMAVCDIVEAQGVPPTLVRVIAVDPRYLDLLSWVEFIRRTAPRFPADPCVTITSAGVEHRLVERSELMLNQQFLRLERAVRPGIPGKDTVMGIAVLGESLTRDVVASALVPFLDSGNPRLIAL
jgi:hypothetical protein